MNKLAAIQAIIGTQEIRCTPCLKLILSISTLSQQKKEQRNVAPFFDSILVDS